MCRRVAAREERGEAFRRLVQQIALVQFDTRPGDRLRALQRAHERDHGVAMRHEALHDGTAEHTRGSDDAYAHG